MADPVGTRKLMHEVGTAQGGGSQDRAMAQGGGSQDRAMATSISTRSRHKCRSVTSESDGHDDGVALRWDSRYAATYRVFGLGHSLNQ